ncbi:hypothetical protein MBANPS3_006236 [Mucor bainieri]
MAVCANHLQEVRDDNSTDGSLYSQSPSIAEAIPASAAISSCHTARNTNINSFEQTSPPFSNQQQPLEMSTDIAPLIDDADLMNFLENDLDKYLTTTNTNSSFVTSTDITGIN